MPQNPRDQLERALVGRVGDEGAEDVLDENHRVVPEVEQVEVVNGREELPNVLRSEDVEPT